MKKIFSYFLIVGMFAFVACSEDEFGETPPFNHPTKSLSVEGLEDGKLTVDVERKGAFTIVFDPVYASDQKEFVFDFKSTDVNVISIDKEGKYKAGSKPGKANVTITPTNKTDKAFTFEVEVIKVEAEKIGTKTDFSKGMKVRLGGYTKIGDIIFTPETTSIQTVEYSSSDELIAKVVEVTEIEGEGKDAKEVKYWAVEGLKAGGAKISVKSADNPKVIYTFDVNVVDWNLLEKGGWEILSSSLEQIDGEKGKKENLIDGDVATYLSLAKPGKLGLEANKKAFIIVNTGGKEAFSGLQFTYSNKDDLSKKVKKISVSGSADLSAWAEIQSDIEVKEIDEKNPGIKSALIELPEEVNFQYFKIEITGWSAEGSETIQLAELNLFKLK